MPATLEQGLQSLAGSTVCELVGFSFGGMVAGLWAQAYAQRFSRLVLLAPPGLGRPAIERIRPLAWRHLDDPQARLRIHTHNLGELMLHHEDSVSPLVCRLQQLNAERDRLPSRRLARTDVLARALQQLRGLAPELSEPDRQAALGSVRPEHRRSHRQALPAPLAQLTQGEG